VSLEERRRRRGMPGDARRLEKIAAEVGGNREGGKDLKKPMVGCSTPPPSHGRSPQFEPAIAHQCAREAHLFTVQTGGPRRLSGARLRGASRSGTG